MIERFLEKHVFPYPFRFRMWLIAMAPVVPFLWVCCVVAEQHESDPFWSAYPHMWEAFKKGERI